MSDVQETFLDLPILIAGEFELRALKPRDVPALFEMCSNEKVAK